MKTYYKLFIALVFLSFLSGCSVFEEAAEKAEVEKKADMKIPATFIETSKVRNTAGSTIYTFVDVDTGVEYILTHGYESQQLTPRLNADGTLFTSNPSYTDSDDEYDSEEE